MLALFVGTKQECQNPQEVDHQSWATRVTLTGVRIWKDPSEKVSDKCKPYSKKQGDSGRRMRYCNFRHLHQAPLIANNQGVGERTLAKTRRHDTLEMQSLFLMNMVYGLMKDPYHPVTHHRTKARIPLVSHPKGDAIGNPSYRIQCA